MQRILSPFCAVYLLVGTTASAQSPAATPVTVTIAESPGYAIPADFAGLSFESSNLLPDKKGKYLFSAGNKSLIGLFRAIGIKSLRVGGGTVDMPSYALPSPADIDNLFAFAKAGNVRVIYSFRMLNGDKTNAATVAKYIWQNYRSQLDSFSIGNEPDWRSYHKTDPKITDYPSYLADWQSFAAAIAAAAPGAKFSGPDTGSNYAASGAGGTNYDGESWTRRFADDEKGSGFIAEVLQHDYVGQGAKGVSVPTAIDAMLSPAWDAVNYPALYDGVLSHVAADGLAFRMTECNDYTGGVNGASNAFASALWALDYMHWWAAHGCAGVNFHNRRWIINDTITMDSTGAFRVNPKAYGIKAFDLGSHGNSQPVTLSQTDGINLTAYAVRDPKELFVTIINKEHGIGARDANVTIVSDAHFSRPTAVFLTAPAGNVTAETGVTLGGATLGDDRPWGGQWTPLTTDKTGRCVVKVSAASAAVVKLPIE